MSHRLPLAVFLAALLTLAAAIPASAAKRRPDLRPAAVGGVPTAGQPPGARFLQPARIRNRGRATARSSVVGLFLSTNARRDRGDTRLGTARTGKIRRRRAVRRRIRAALPATAAPGAYRLIVCADIRRKVRERREGNNCRTAARRLTVMTPPGPPLPPPGPPRPIEFDDGILDPPPPPPPTLAFHLDDGHDYGLGQNAAHQEVQDGDVVTLSLRMAAGVPGAAGYDRAEVADEPFIGGATSTLAFDETDDAQNTVALPFTMPFAGVPYGEASVSTNGWASFGEPGADYWNDNQPEDFRGLEHNVGEYARGVMPFWLDGDLEECCNPDPQERGPGEVRVVNPGDGRLAVQWEINSHEEGDTPRREMQALLFGDGRIRYDYDDAATSPDTDDDAFVGLSPGTGEDVLDVIARETRTTPGSSYLYTPRPVSPTGAPAGKVSVTLPFGSAFDSADSGCSLVKAPTGREDGLVECDTPEIAGGSGAIKQVRFVMPDRNVNPGSVANVAYEATWQVGDEELTDEEELAAADGYADSQATLDINYTGPAGQGAGAPLEFTVIGTFSDTAREPVVTIDIPEGFELESTTLPDCSDAPSGFGGGQIDCVLSSGVQNFTRTVTFEAEANGTYEVEGELVADNADADTDTAGLTVPVP